MVVVPVRAFVVALGTATLGAGCSNDAVPSRPAHILDAAFDVATHRDAAPLVDGAVRRDAASSCDRSTCGGSCLDGRCLVTLAIAPSPGNLVVRGVDAFFTTCSTGMGGVAKASLDPASPFELGAGRQCPSGLALNGQRLYVGGANGFVDSDGSSVELAALSLDVDAADAAPSLLVAGSDPIVGVAADGADVYFTTTTSLMRVAASGGSPRALLSDLGSATRPLLDQTNVYVGDASSGAVIRVARNSGVPSTLATGLPAIQVIALGATDVLVGGAYLVRTVALDGGAIGVVATAAGAEIQSVASDAANAYFTSYGVVWKAPLHGGAEPLALASNRSDAVAIAVDDASVYWIDAASDGGAPGACCGRILKLTPK